MFVGVLSLDLLLGDVHSLKEKRSVVRPIVAELRKRYDVAAAEAGHLDLHRRALIGVAVVAPDRAHCVEVLDACERLVAARPEVELLSARRQFVKSDRRGSLRRTTSHGGHRACAQAGRPHQGHRCRDPRDAGQGPAARASSRHRRAGHRRPASRPRSSTPCYGDDDAAGRHGRGARERQGRPALEVGRQTGVRRTPSLAFFADAVPENAAHIEDLLAKVAAADAEVHRAAAGATYAGDADPYKAPRVDDEDDDAADEHEAHG